jgi:putative intracellular protease/amidase
MKSRSRILKIVFSVFGIIAAAFIVLVIAGPSILQAMGLHPEYAGQRYLLPEGKALIIATNHDELGDSGRKTGVFGSELTAPYYEFQGGRMHVDVASIEGGEIPFDPASFNYLITSDYDDRMQEDSVLQEKVRKSLSISTLDFTKYDIIFLAGGWGAAYDLGFSKELGQKISEAYAAGAVIGGVCHGPLGLLNATDVQGKPLVEGRTVTAVTDKQVEELNITMTPQHPETELRSAGANFQSSTAFRDFFASHVEIDGRIVTGQNQNDGPEVANLMMKLAGGSRR